MNKTAIRREGFANAYLALAQLFSYPCAESRNLFAAHGLLDPTISLETLELEFLAVFELGDSIAPPLPLFEGMHRQGSGRDGILMELSRFYDFFDVQLAQNPEYPDHLGIELEFLAWLCQQETVVQQRGGNAQAFRRAQRDFLTRHLLAWVPAFCSKLQLTRSLYAQYGALLNELVQTHGRQLVDDAMIYN